VRLMVHGNYAWITKLLLAKSIKDAFNMQQGTVHLTTDVACYN